MNEQETKITDEMVAAFGAAWAEANEIDPRWRSPGDRTRAGLKAVAPLILGAENE